MVRPVAAAVRGVGDGRGLLQSRHLKAGVRQPAEPGRHGMRARHDMLAVLVANVVGRLEIAAEEKPIDRLRSPEPSVVDFKRGPFAVEKRMHRGNHERAAGLEARRHRGHGGGGILDEFERMGAVHEIEALVRREMLVEVLETRFHQPYVHFMRLAKAFGMDELALGDVHGRADDALLREPDAVLRSAATELERRHARLERGQQAQPGLAGNLRAVMEIVATDFREGLVAARQRVPIAALPMDVDFLAHRPLPPPGQPLKTIFLRAT